ncbi:hypothetical protein GQ53DRAFT_811551 [Thozetella sp. PMI_491]|nr:hypothetical protein GQ53DRAFT_811551 [Thozetella sp. PMI_491]
MAATEFTLFPLLPWELRRAVWELCLPKRVAELDQVMIDSFSPETDGIEPECQFAWTSGTNSSPPVISAVCREARQIAWEAGGALDVQAADPAWGRPEDFESDGGAAYYSMNIIRHPWVDKRTDVLHFNYVPHLSVSYDAYGDAISYFVDEAYRCQGLSLMAEVLLDFSERISDDPDYGWTNAELRPLRRLKECFVTITMVNLHVPRAAASRSGLFGLLGDATIQLVDPYDLNRIRSFYNLWAQESAKFAGPKAAFDLFLSETAKFHALIKAWSAEVEALWVWSESANWQPSFANSDINSQMWLDWGGGEVDLDGRARKPNREHPEVQRILASKPVFRPMIMFRLCANPSCLSTAEQP